MTVAGILITVGSHYLLGRVSDARTRSQNTPPEQVGAMNHESAAVPSAANNAPAAKSGDSARSGTPLRPAQYGGAESGSGTRSQGMPKPSASASGDGKPALAPTAELQVEQKLPDGRTLKERVVSGKQLVLIEHVRNADRLEKEGKLEEADAELERAIESSLVTADLLKKAEVLEDISERFDDSVQSRMLAQGVLLANRMGDKALSDRRFDRFMEHTPPPDIKAHLVKVLIDRGRADLVRHVVEAARDADDEGSQRFMELLSDPNFPEEEEL